MRGSVQALADSISVSSVRWRAARLVLTLVGALFLFRAGAYLLQADGALRSVGTDYAQAYLGVGGVLLLILDLCWVAFGVMASISTSAVSLRPQHVRVANVRSVLLAWPMIDGVTTIPAGRRLIPGLHLITGEVVPIRFAARLPARTQPASVIASSAVAVS